MNKYTLLPGCYSLPMGSDMLWHLGNHLSSTEPHDTLILLPTDRAVHRLKRILYKLNQQRSETIRIQAYDELAVESVSDSSTMQQILWSLIDDPQVLDEFFLSSSPTQEQKQQLCLALSSNLSELFTHEIDPTELARLAESDPSTRQLSRLMTRYQALITQHNSVHPATAFNEGIRKFHGQLSTSEQRVYLIIDGPIPESLQTLALTLSKDHYVWVSGDVTGVECPPYDPRYCYASLAKRFNDAGQSIHPLTFYTHRKPLIDELQRPVFNSKHMSGLFKDLHFIESKDAISLAQHIIQIAQSSFSETVRSLSVVTPSRELAKIIHHTAVASGILVDDSCGIALHETTLGSVVLNLLRYLMDPTNYKLLLDTIMHPLMWPYWGGLPSKVDAFGRKKEISFMTALRTYTPEDDIENSHLLELIHLCQPSIHRTFQEMLKAVFDTLSKWNIKVDEFQEYKVITELANALESFEVFEYILKSTPYRTLTPKEHHLQIMGPLEARLTHPKVVIIADLNEGDWPISMSSNPWLHPKLRAHLGLPNSAQITGISSKILLSLLGCQTVYLCRTTLQNNQLTLPSRWWERLKILRQLNQVSPYVHSLTNPAMTQHTPPMLSFKIPPALIPHRLSISNFHLLLNSPEEFLLTCILKLDELPMWETPADLRDKGIIVHNALEHGLKENLSIEEMISYAIDQLNKLTLDPHQRMFWKSQVTDHLYNFNQLHKETHPEQTWAEVSGEWTVTTQSGTMVIVGKADRIDLLPDGSLHIIDYKTGTLPSKQSVYQGMTPQLPLLGMMAARGCFKGIPSTKPFMVSYWDLKEGKTLNFLFDELYQLEHDYIQALDRLMHQDTEHTLTR